MFGLGWGEMLALAVVALVVFGPDKLPQVARQAGNALRQVRRMASSAQNDLREGLGPEFKDFDVTDLNPRNFVRKHLLEDMEDDFMSTPLEPEPAAVADDIPDDRRPPYDPEAT